MQLLINGLRTEVESSTLAELLNHLGHADGTFAVAIDGEHVPRHNWGKSKLIEDQSVEIIAPMQGG